MNEIIEILRKKFSITKIIIENFTKLNMEMSIYIELELEENKFKRIVFKNVSGLEISSENYSCSELSSVIIQDIPKK
ncbi:hypothetical protein [Arachidicoccus ginsenosidimutans]|uniref:hypothetical protein n=1 Tax=Arachidicoccus sp. BS20 TaxID=1850526 RepID=UPI0012E8B85D|nr:hypothetical protein [Arachidicoccus sp. BS20]